MGKLNKLIAIVLILCWSCEKSPDPEPDDDPTPSGEESSVPMKLYVLNEGLFNQNNSTLSYIDLQSGEVTRKYFEEVNGAKLGDTGNDMIIYGNKAYIAVNNSNNLTVINKATGELIERISMVNESGVGRQPRRLAAWKDKVLLTNFDGTVAVVDTAGLSVGQFVEVGRNPEGIAVYNDKAYVANSGGLDAPDYDTTVSVIDLHQMAATSIFTVGVNPGSVVSDHNGHIYVIRRGNYGDVPSRLKVWSTESQSFEKTYDFDASGVSVSGDSVLVTYYDHGSGDSDMKIIDASSLSIVDDHFLSAVEVNTLYSAYKNEVSGKVYISDAMDFQASGKVMELSSEGEKLREFDVGINPGTLTE